MIGSHRPLLCHPDAPCRYVRALFARVQRIPDGALSLAFALDGMLDRLRIPPPGPPRPAERLWEHTCFEAFVGLKDSPAYHEFNLAPSREWAVYAFRRYREGMAREPDQAPAITVQRTTHRLELGATLHLDRLPGSLASAPVRLALSAVIEDEQGERSYWALRHPPGRPDFHHPAAFALELGPSAHRIAEAKR